MFPIPRSEWIGRVVPGPGYVLARGGRGGAYSEVETDAPNPDADSMVEKPAKTRPRLFLIDGYALIYRSFFAMINRPLTTSRGENTSAAWGVTKFLLKILEEHEPDYLGVVLDAGTSEREARYPAYKATREKMPDELRASIPRIRQILAAFRIPVLELPNHEAD